MDNYLDENYGLLYMTCKLCQELKLENATLKETQVKFVKFDKSANSLREMLYNQKPSSCKIGIGFDSSKASTSGTKPISFVGSSAENATDRSTIKVHGSTIPGSVNRIGAEKVAEHIFSPPMYSRLDFVITRKKLIHNRIEESKKSSLKPSLKSGLESLNVEFNEIPSPTKLSPLVDEDVGEEEAIRNNTKVVNNNNEEDESIEVDEVVNIKESNNHPLDQVIGNLNQRTLRSQAQDHSNFFCFISTIEPKDARLVAQGYNQQEGIDYDETYTSIASLESIRILLAIAYANDFKLYQMDVKSASLNEEVYVAQPSGFIDFQKPNYIYKLKKALYGLKQALKAWYDRLKTFFIKHKYSMGMSDNTLCTKKSKSHFIIFKIYVNDIIFGSMSQNLCDDFAKIMHDEFEMGMMGELNFLLGLQIKQMEDGIFFNQSKYIKEMLKKFGLEDSKPTKMPMSTKIKLTRDDEADSMDSSKYRENHKTTHLEAVKRTFRHVRGTTHLGLWYLKGTGVETIVYANSDHVGDYVDRKITSDVCTFMGCCLTSWTAKKQMALAISTTEAEHVFARKACQRALWMKQALIDYDLRLDDVSIMCDNKGAIDLSLDELEKTLEQIPPYSSGLLAIDDIRNLIHQRTTHEKIDKEGKTIHKLPNLIETNDLFDRLRPCELVIRENVYSAIENRDHTQAITALMKMSPLKAKQPKKPPPKRTRNVGKSKRVELTTSSSTESPPSDNRDLPSTKLSPRSYIRALPPNPNMSKEQKKTRGMFKNLGRALHEFAKMLKKGCH
nr:retrovirus-related Pol polyprotein from transposon TNT 1-94 [Tanacetum cinerariifolium]